MSQPRPRRSEEQRFWDWVDKGPAPSSTPGSTCWLWVGSVTRSSGYGKFHRSDGRTVDAHRLAWELTHGPIPDGMEVCHACDVKLCVRHLFLGTRADNERDKVSKGRQKGPQVSPRVAHLIARHFRQEGGGLVDIARRFSLDVSAVRRIRRAKR